ncbi:MAG: glycosyltransferase [Candidatus Omnitrophica bacterium]|nr:glycosyltransferase [Candidatus Omnitrophota bacterium]
MESPHLSIVIPVYNAQRYIKRCIDSVLKQSLPSDQYDVIVVNDGSSDDTGTILKGYGNKICVISQLRKGPAVARNLGARHGRGKVLLFTDADCIADVNWARNMLVPFSNANADIVQGVYRTNQKQMVARFAQIEIEQRYYRMEVKQCIDMIGTYSAAFRKEIFERFKGFNETFPMASGEDLEFIWRIRNQSKDVKIVLNRDAYVFHTHPATFRAYWQQKYFRAYWRIGLYLYYRKKIVAESYTPTSLKLSVLLILISPFVLLCCIALRSNWIYLVISLYLLFLFFSYLPLFLFVVNRDFLLGLASPYYITARAVALAFGVLGWFLDKLLGRVRFAD